MVLRAAAFVRGASALRAAVLPSLCRVTLGAARGCRRIEYLLRRGQKQLDRFAPTLMAPCRCPRARICPRQALKRVLPHGLTVVPAAQNTASERARCVEGRRRGRPRCFQMTVFTGSRFLHRVSAKNPVQNLCESLSNLCKHSLAAKTVCVCDYGHHSHTFTLPSGHSLTLTHLRTTAAPPTHATYNHFHRQFAPVLPVTSCRILEHSFVDLNLCT